MSNKYDYRQLREFINANHDRFSELNYDTSLSTTQKMNALVEWFKVMLKEYNALVEYLDDFKDKFDENLYTTVEEILNKWLDDGVFNQIINEVIKTNITLNVQWFGAKGDNINDDTEAIQRALDFMKNIEDETKQQGTVIYFPRTESNKYIVTKNLVVHTNTTLIGDSGVRLMRHATDGQGFLVNGYQNKEYLNTAGHTITIKNLIFDGNPFDCSLDDPLLGFGMIWFGKTKNIKIEDCTFLDVYTNHAIDVVDIDGLTIINCKFLGFQDKSAEQNRGYAEAIQLSVHLEGWGLVELPPYTYKGCRNVVIDGCVFGNSNRSCSKSWNRAIGDHQGRYNVFNENIDIKNCSFNNHSYAIFIPKWNKVKIHDNVFNGSTIDIHCRANLLGEGTSLDSNGVPQKAQGMEDIFIYDNQFFNTSYDNIQIWGAWDKENYTNLNAIAYNKNIVISGNKVKNTGGRFVHTKFNDGIVISNNECYNVNFALFHTFNKNIDFLYNVIDTIGSLVVYHDTSITDLPNDMLTNMCIGYNVFSNAKGSVINIPKAKNLTISYNHFKNVAYETKETTLIVLGNDINGSNVSFNTSDLKNSSNISYGVYVGENSTNVMCSDNILGGYWSDNYSVWKNVKPVNCTSNGNNRYRITTTGGIKTIIIEYDIVDYKGGVFFPLPQNIGLYGTKYYSNSLSGYSPSSTGLSSSGLFISQSSETILSTSRYTGVIQFSMV